MNLTKDKFISYDEAVKREWLLTNGIGGYASSTVIGANTRKYHGLLIASLYFSGERYMVLSKVNEKIKIGNDEYSISSNECPNYIENGYIYQEYFDKENIVTESYTTGGVEINKKISMAHGENKVAVSYTIKNIDRKSSFYITPFVNFRKIHEVRKDFDFTDEYEDSILSIKLNNDYNLYIVCDGEFTKFDNTIYNNMYYREENERGLEDTENQYMPGTFKIELEKNEIKKISFVATVEKKMDFAMPQRAEEIVRKEIIRTEMICKIAGAKSEKQKLLAIAADNFLIDTKYGKNIIAGYPWFDSWGRDTFISFEGLTLKTNRYMDAKSILISYAENIENGLVPNFISDSGGQSYNTVDASLWYINAIYKYISYTKDLDTLKYLYPYMIKIIDAYKSGTLYNIKMDKDYLITAGDQYTQLTWMDAKVGDLIPTPRYGKAVEINALWYNALMCLESLSNMLGEHFDTSISKNVKKSFKKFYLDEGLYDTIEPFNNDIRPNQLLAISLTFPVVGGEKEVDVFSTVTSKLYTDKGLKTLDSNSKNYKPYYSGDVYSRDTSYHQGTIWPWLLEPYFGAYNKIYKSKYIFDKTEELLSDRCIGSISEIYDAEEPRMAKGAIAQAWSVSAMIMQEF